MKALMLLRLHMLVLDGLRWTAERVRDAAPLLGAGMTDIADYVDKMADGQQRTIATVVIENWAFQGKSKAEYRREAQQRASERAAKEFAQRAQELDADWASRTN